MKKSSYFAHGITRRDFLNGTAIGMGGLLSGPEPNLSHQQTRRAPLSILVGTATVASATTARRTATRHKLSPMLIDYETGH